jgi:hypothetical protein
MLRLRNQKGAVLITVYLVVTLLLALSGILFSRSIQERNLVQREQAYQQALYNAERGLAYAYFECKRAGWSWFTHSWDQTSTPWVLQSNNLASTAAQRTQGASVDCHFIPTGQVNEGCYAANDGSFILRTFPDPNEANVTVIRVLGISGDIQRAVEHREVKRAVSNYFLFSAGDLGVAGSWDCGGGGIHANGKIVLDTGARIDNVSELSTGENMSIAYQWLTYSHPTWLDDADGISGNNNAPLPDLAAPHIWSVVNPYPYVGGHTYETNWSTAGSTINMAQLWPAGPGGVWPPQDWRNTNSHFSGSPNVGSALNAWLTPVEKDALGNPVFDPATGQLQVLPAIEIPGHLNQQWAWDKYSGSNPAAGISFIDGAGNPATAVYWSQLDAAYPGLIDPEILDGVYGNEGNTVLVTNTNSIQQDADWDTFVSNSNLGKTLVTNDQGFELTEPDYSGNYKRLAQSNGLYFSLDMTNSNCQSWNANPDDNTARQACLSASIDDWKTQLNQGGSSVADNPSFINTFTAQSNEVLEIDLAEMLAAGNYPQNGFIYSQIPLRLTNAQTLPSTAGTFNVISEENVYLKGDYNSLAATWKSSAIVSKKKIYSLSADFNDPQVLPALPEYLNYPYLCVADVGGVWKEVAESTQGSIWVHRNYLTSHLYAGIPDADEDALALRIDVKQLYYEGLFNHDDSTGQSAATFNWTRDGDGSVETYTWGMLPNLVQNDTTQNCLLVAAREGAPGPPSAKTYILERWEDALGTPRILDKTGAFSDLEGFPAAGAFASALGDYTDGEISASYPNRAIPISYRGVSTAIIPLASRNAINPDMDFGVFAATTLAYDQRFLSPTGAVRIFFSGGPPSTWRELAPSAF